MDHPAAQALRGGRACYVLLRGERLAVPVPWVREVVVFDELTRVPTAAPHLLGIANLRGTAVPVLDAGPALGLTPQAVAGRCLALVVTAGLLPVALLVDRVLGLDTPAEVIPLETTASAARAAFGLGLVRHPDGMALLVNLPPLLDAVRGTLRLTA
jgi:purine-binding chemotaxis protein CheW